MSKKIFFAATLSLFTLIVAVLHPQQIYASPEMNLQQDTQTDSSIVELHAFASTDSLTLFVPQAASLSGFKFGVYKNSNLKLIALADYFDALHLSGNLANANDCYVFQLDGMNPPLSQACKGQVYRKNIPLADVFWYDTVRNNPLDLSIYKDGEPTGIICSSVVPDCIVKWNGAINKATATPEFASASQDEVLVIVAEFDRQGGQTVEAKTMYEQLQVSIQMAINDPLLKDLPIRLERTKQVVLDRPTARNLSDKNNATIVIWGNVANSILTTYYEITPRWGQNVKRAIEQTDFKARPSTISLIDQVTYRFENAIDQIFVTKFMLAQLLYSSQKYKAALPLFEDILSQIQTEPIDVQKQRGIADAWFYVGYILEETQEDSLGAEDAFTHAIKVNPQYVLAYNGRGAILDRLGEYDKAISDFSKAISINPRLDYIYNNRALSLFNQGKLVDAIADFSKAISIAPYNSETYYNRGNTSRKMGKLDDAIADYTRAILFEPQYLAAYNNRGLSFQLQGKANEAIADFSKTIEINSQFSAGYNNRGLVLSTLFRFDDAIADFDKAIELDPQNATTYVSRGIILGTQGNPDKAITDFKKAIALDSHYVIAYVLLGRFFDQEGNLSEALRFYHLYIDIVRDDALSTLVQRVQELEAMLKTATPTPTP